MQYIDFKNEIKENFAQIISIVEKKTFLFFFIFYLYLRNQNFREKKIFLSTFSLFYSLKEENLRIKNQNELRMKITNLKIKFTNLKPNLRI